MKRFVLIVPTMIICNLVCCKLQGQQITTDSLVGTWKGTSLCQVKNSPCHDEIVVYHIKKGNTPDSCSIQANKIVNGVEEDMGTLSCKVDNVNNQLISLANGAKWVFKIRNGKMEGTLIYNNNLFRIIQVSKIK